MVGIKYIDYNYWLQKNKKNYVKNIVNYFTIRLQLQIINKEINIYQKKS